MKNHSKIILIHYIGYAKPNSIKSLYLITNKVNIYIEEHNGNKYLTLVHTDKRNDALKKYEQLWKKIKDHIRSKIITQVTMMKSI